MYSIESHGIKYFETNFPIRLDRILFLRDTDTEEQILEQIIRESILRRELYFVLRERFKDVEID